MYSEIINNFLTIYNIGMALTILLFVGQISTMNKKTNKNLLKARLFLNGERINNTILYISIAGASIAIATLSNILNTIYNIQTMQLTIIAQITFLLTFLLALYNWHIIINHP